MSTMVLLMLSYMFEILLLSTNHLTVRWLLFVIFCSKNFRKNKFETNVLQGRSVKLISTQGAFNHPVYGLQKYYI